MEFKLEPKADARCVVCGIVAGYHPVIVHAETKVCVGCYEDKDLIRIPLVMVNGEINEVR